MIFKYCSLKWSDHLIQRLILPALITSLGVTGAIAVTRHLGWWQDLELNTFDHLVHLQPTVDIDDRFLVVEITDADLQALQKVPLSDTTIAQALANLQRYDPKVIGLDIYRDIPNPPGTEVLKTQLKQDNVILIKNLENGGAVPTISEIPEERFGFNLFVVDADNVQRRNLLALKYQGEQLSFGLLIAQKYLDKSDYPVKLKSNGLFLGEYYFPTLQSNSGNYQLPSSESRGWQTLLNFSASPSIAPKVTISDVLKHNFDPNLVTGKIVLIGSTAATQKDLFITPYSGDRTDNYLTAGVYLHALAIQQILDHVAGQRSLFRFWRESEEILWIFFWSSTGSMITCFFHRPGVFLGVSASSLLMLGILGYALFTLKIWVPITSPAIAMMLSWGSMIAYRLFYEEKYDVLTGTPNRQLFLQQLNHFSPVPNRENQDYYIAVLSLDINHFKSINESYGHRFGDKFLKQIVRRIRHCLKGEALLSRIGGNEFGVFIKFPQSKQDILEFVQKIENSLIQPFVIDEKKIYTTVSIGIAFQLSTDVVLPEDLWLNAHTAMNRAKQSKKNQHEIFVIGMQKQSLDRLTIENDLRQAIENEEFYLVYQPIFSLSTDTLAGFESLVRWKSPTRGIVSPDEFITIAEETNLILPISQWVLEEGCTQLKKWQNQFELDENLTMSINLSSRQFGQVNLKQQLEEILKKTGLSPSTLKLEITESMVIDDVKDAIQMLHELKTLKIKLSIDDFGTGHSSLKYLNDFPVDTLKIDRSFVVGIENTSEQLAIPRAVIALGHNLGMDIVAEGIETEQQLAALKSLNCEFGQGFFFSKPLNKYEATLFLKKFSRSKFDPAIAQEIEQVEIIGF